MVDAFDPYYDWLGIPPEEQPPHHYRLLGVALYEQNLDALTNAADRQMAHLRTFQAGRRAAESQKLLNEIASARICLLDAKKKAEYDAALKLKLDAANGPTKPAVRPAPKRKERPSSPVPEITIKPVAATVATATSATARRRAWILPLAIGGAAIVLLAVVIALLLPNSKTVDRLTHDDLAGAGTDNGPLRDFSDATDNDASTNGSRDVGPRPDTHSEPGGNTTPNPSLPRSVRRITIEPGGSWLNLTQLIDPSRDARSGRWSRAAVGGVHCAADSNTCITVPVVPKGIYELRIDVQRRTGTGSFGVHIPVGSRAVAALFFTGTDQSRAHQLRVIEGTNSPDNVISAPATAPRPGERYQIAIKVVRQGSDVVVGVEINGRAILFWSGPEANLSAPAESVPGNGRAVGLYSYLSELEFRGIHMRAAADSMQLLYPSTTTPSSPSPAGGRVVGAVLDKELEGHTDRVRALAFGFDGRVLLSGGKDNSVRIWSPQTGKSIGAKKGHTSTVHSIALAERLKKFASGGADDTVRIWDIANGNEVAQYSGHGGTVWSVAFSPDAGHIAAAGKDKKITIRRVDSGVVTHTLTGHSSDVLAVSFSPDGRYLASTGYDRTVRLWDWQARTHRVLGHVPAGATCVAFSPTGRLLAASGGERAIRLWEIPSGRQVAAMTGCTNTVWAVAFSSDGGTVAAGGQDQKVRLFDVATKKMIATLDGHKDQIYAVAFSQDGQMLASAGHDQKIRMWKLQREGAASVPPDLTIDYLEVAAAGAPQDQPAPTGEPPVVATRQKVPNSADVSAALDEIKQLFKDEYAAAGKPDEEQALARQLLGHARADELTEPQRYALWREAHRLAMQAGDVGLALQVVELIGQRYEFQVLKAISSTLTTTAKKLRSIDARQELAETALKFVDQAVAADDLDASEEMIEAAVSATSGAREKALRDLRLQANKRKDEIRALKRFWTAAEEARAVLSKDPDNAEAHLGLAKYYCLIKGDWPRGLPHMAKSGDATLVELAAAEAKEPTDAALRTALGDKWYAAASGLSRIEREKFIERACFWYVQAVGDLDGLELARVEKRLAANDENYRRTAEGLAGHWKLDETEGGVAHDATGRQDGQLSGSVALLLREREGSRGVLGFTGQQWIQYSGRDFGDTFSIATWVKASRSGNYAILLANTWPRFDLEGFRLVLDTGKSSTGQQQLRRVRFNTAKKGQPAMTAQSHPGAIAFGRWTHVAVTVNRPAGTARIYIDGKDATEESAIRKDFPTASDNWYIGSARGHYDEFKYQGYLSDFRIYQRELSLAEIVRLARLRGS